MLSDRYGFKPNGADPIKNHLGYDFMCDGSGELCIAPKLVDSHTDIFGCKPKTMHHSPLKKGD